MTVKKWLMVCCLCLISLFVQAETQEESSSSDNKISMSLDEFILLVTTQLLKQSIREGQQACQVGDHHTALEKWLEGLELAREEYQPAIPVFLNNICGAYSSLGNFQKALEYCNESLEKLTRVNGLYQLKKQTLNNIGVVYRELGEYQKALVYHQRALDHKFIDKEYNAHTLNNIGLVYQALNEYQKALDAHLQALTINRQLDSKPEEAKTLNNIGSVYMELVP